MYLNSAQLLIVRMKSYLASTLKHVKNKIKAILLFTNWWILQVNI